jgi:hypothetical protein
MSIGKVWKVSPTDYRRRRHVASGLPLVRDRQPPVGAGAVSVIVP